MGFLETLLWSVLHARSLLLGAIVFLFFAYVFRKRRPQNCPPGPPSLFILRNFFGVNFEKSHLQIQQMVKRYGNVISFAFGDMHIVLLSGLPLIKEALVHQDQHFINRPLTAIHERCFKRKGLVFSTGQIWKEQRRFTLTTLRNFGLGKKGLEECIQEEAYYLVQSIKEENGEFFTEQPFDPHFKITNAVANIICSVTFGERFEYQDEKFQELLRMMDEIVHLDTSVWCQFCNILPRIIDLLPGPHRTLFKNWENLKLFVAEMIENHKRDWNPNETRDFIDAYLKEMEKHKGDTTTSFDEENLICTTLDIFMAGTETTSTILRWALLYMALYPDIQEKVHAEIDRVIGQVQHPSTAHRESMSYTHAVVHEVQRMGNIIPLNVPREVAADTILSGYYLQKETMILTNITSLHNDPDQWATPDTFNPEHFLENGQFKKREDFLPFSIGKRACLGEQLARTELFIFFTTLLQKFTFRPPENEKLTQKFRFGSIIGPVKYRICAVPRA